LDITTDTRTSHGAGRLWPHEPAEYRPCISTTVSSSLFVIRDFDVADEIANDLDLIGIVFCNLHAGEFIFHQYHQLEAIEPVGAEVVAEVRFIRNTSDIDTEILGDEGAHSVGLTILLCRYSLS
jgi:hypothetical protein